MGRKAGQPFVFGRLQRKLTPTVQVINERPSYGRHAEIRIVYFTQWDRAFTEHNPRRRKCQRRGIHHKWVNLHESYA
jgi:hypothetical protein